MALRSFCPLSVLTITFTLFPKEVVAMESCAMPALSEGLGLECLNDGETAQWLRAGLLLPLQLTWVDSEHSHCSSQQPVTPVRGSKTF